MSSVLPIGRAIIHRKSGRIVGPIAPIYTEDWPYQEVSSRETLWRYLDFNKFEDLLKTSAIYFSRPDRFVDPFEGRYSNGNKNSLSKSEEAFRRSYHIADNHEGSADYQDLHRNVIFISCWHRNTHDTYKMWDAYTKTTDSVVITTTVKALKVHLPASVIQYGVTYAPLDAPRTEFSHNSLFFYQPIELSFEREYRLLRQPGEDEEFFPDKLEDSYRRILIPLRKVVHRVIVHPEACNDTKRKVHELIREKCQGLHASDSKLKKRILHD